MKICNLIVGILILTLVSMSHAAETPEQLVRDFINEILDSNCDYSSSLECFKYRNKYIANSFFKQKKIDKSKFTVNWQGKAFDDFRILSFDPKSSLVKVEIYAHEAFLQNHTYFKVVKEGGKYVIFPSKFEITKYGKYIEPWQSIEEITYSYAGEKTERLPDSVGIVKPLGLVIGETSEQQAIDKLKELGGKIEKSGARFIAGASGQSNPDVTGMLVNGIQNLKEIKLWFYKGKLFNVDYSLDGNASEQAKVYRDKYGREGIKLRYGQDGRKLEDEYMWLFRGVKLQLSGSIDNSKTYVSYINAEMSNSANGSDAEIIKKEKAKENMKKIINPDLL